jgi:hypothetical protein
LALKELQEKLNDAAATIPNMSHPDAVGFHF